MTVTIDPSEVRRQASVKRSFRVPRRVMLVAGLGSVGLIAFTYGAFSFFSGLADPRVRTVRPTMVAANMPDLKDGLPALVQDSGPAPKQTTLNLPRPFTSEPTPAATETALRTDTSIPAAAAAAPSQPPIADATGSVSTRAAVKAGEPTPAIENAPTISGNPKQAALIGPDRMTGPLAPAKSETVRAKSVEARAVAAITSSGPAVDAPTPAAAPKKAITAKPAKAKVAKAVPHAVVEASAELAPVAASKADEDDSDGISSKLKSGIKAIGGIFGNEE